MWRYLSSFGQDTSLYQPLNGAVQEYPILRPCCQDTSLSTHGLYCTGVSYPEQLLPGYQSVNPWVVLYRCILPWAAAARIPLCQPLSGAVKEYCILHWATAARIPVYLTMGSAVQEYCILPWAAAVRKPVYLPMGGAVQKYCILPCAAAARIPVYSINLWVLLYRSILPWAAAARIPVYQPMVGAVQGIS